MSRTSRFLEGESLDRERKTEALESKVPGDRIVLKSKEEMIKLIYFYGDERPRFGGRVVTISKIYSDSWMNGGPYVLIEEDNERNIWRINLIDVL